MTQEMPPKKDERKQSVSTVRGRISYLSKNCTITYLSEKSKQRPSSSSRTSSGSETTDFHNMDISTRNVLCSLNGYIKDEGCLKRVWVAPCAYITKTCKITNATTMANVRKNRYPEVVPYDHTRVVLKAFGNASFSDYINASRIIVDDPSNPGYIATQGPLQDTVGDFWQLIWEQDVIVIVMLTRLNEADVEMCHRYWPETGSLVYHVYEVCLDRTVVTCTDYLARHFWLINLTSGDRRSVTQFHFLTWPESGIPASTTALLDFRKRVNVARSERPAPIVVHCSDGSSRTGTYCLIDMLQNRIANGANEINIKTAVAYLRKQRPRMVANKEQLLFAIKTLAEETQSTLEVLSPQIALPIVHEC